MAHFRIAPFACAFALAALASSLPTEADAKKKLTCSFIANQCTRECVKEAPEGFCGLYCQDKKRECLNTGEWTGISRQFQNVIKK